MSYITVIHSYQNCKGINIIFSSLFSFLSLMFSSIQITHDFIYLFLLFFYFLLVFYHTFFICLNEVYINYQQLLIRVQLTEPKSLNQSSGFESDGWKKNMVRT